MINGPSSSFGSQYEIPLFLSLLTWSNALKKKAQEDSGEKREQLQRPRSHTHGRQHDDSDRKETLELLGRLWPSPSSFSGIVQCSAVQSVQPGRNYDPTDVEFPTIYVSLRSIEHSEKPCTTG